MKRHCKLIISVLTMALIFALFPVSNVAYADPLSAYMLGQTAYALLNGWGISFNAANASSAGMTAFMENEINEYADYHSSSISELFIGQLAVDAVGKLLIPYTLYNTFVDFGTWLTDKLGLTSSSTKIGAVIPNQDGTFTAVPSDLREDMGFKSVGFSFVGVNGANAPSGRIYYNGEQCGYSTVNASTSWGTTAGYSIFYNNRWCYYMSGLSTDGQTPLFREGYITSNVPSQPQQLSWDGTGYIPPYTVSSTKMWSGFVDGVSEPNVTVDILLEGVVDGIKDNDLDVVGELIDVAPAPTPVPVPTFPPPPPPIPAPVDGSIPIASETSGAVNSWIQGLADFTESVYDGLGTIYQVVSGAIEQALNDIKTLVGELAGWIEQILEALEALGLEITDILENILSAIMDIADSIVNADAEWFDNVVDSILAPFTPWINALKSATGIWHYIIEWLQCINAPFVFFWSVLSGIGACFVKPIYAVSAFAIVIAIYKRFGK